MTARRHNENLHLAPTVADLIALQDRYNAIDDNDPRFLAKMNAGNPMDAVDMSEVVNPKYSFYDSGEEQRW